MLKGILNSLHKSKYIFLSILILFFSIGIQSFVFADFTGTRNEDLFSLRVIQDDKTIEKTDNVYTLKNKPFYFEFTFKKDETIYLNCSHYKKLYTAADEEKDFTSILGFIGTGLAEERRNKDTYLFINDYGWHVWYYFTKDENRFLEGTENEDGTVTCLRYVDSFMEGAQIASLQVLGNTTLNFVYADVKRVIVSRTYEAKEYNNFKLHFVPAEKDGPPPER